MDRVRRILPPFATLAILSLALGACGQSDPSPAEDDGDCVGRIVFRGVLYSPTRDVDRRAAPAERVGGAQVVGCDREPIGETVPVRALAGVAPAVAVRVVGRPWRGTYVADGTPRSSWPTAPTTPSPGQRGERPSGPRGWRGGVPSEDGAVQASHQRDIA